MDAKEFVEKFGLEHAEHLLENTTLEYFAIHSQCAGKYFEDTVYVNDIKTLVDAYELVWLFKGMDNAKAELEACGLNGFEQILVKLDVGVGYVRKHRLMKAIKLVESVDENKTP